MTDAVASSLLDRLRELDGKATPGPWVVVPPPPDARPDFDSEPYDRDPYVGFGPMTSGGWYEEDSTVLTLDNAEAIAAARNALPAVVALVEAADAACRGTAGDGTIRALRAALAPFVGEAT